jgi:26S proteasome regulatory subunit N6
VRALSPFQPCSTALTRPLPVRSLIDHFDPLAAASPEARSTQVAVTRESIEWAREERRVFLRQSLESRLIGL